MFADFDILDVENSPIVGKVRKSSYRSCKGRSLDIEIVNALTNGMNGVILTSQAPGNSPSLIKEDVIVPLKQLDNNTFDLSILEQVDLEISSTIPPINAVTPPISPCKQIIVHGEDLEDPLQMLNNIYELYSRSCYYRPYKVQGNDTKNAFMKLLCLKNHELNDATSRIKELEEILVVKEDQIKVHEQTLAHILDNQNSSKAATTTIVSHTATQTLGVTPDVSHTATQTLGVTPEPSNKLAPDLATPVFPVPFHQTPPDPVVMLQIEAMKTDFENLRKSVYQKFDEMSKPSLQKTEKKDEKIAENNAGKEKETTRKKKNDLQLQLKEVRELKHKQFNDKERSEDHNENYTWTPPSEPAKGSKIVNFANLSGNDSNVVRWKEGTVLITGDSMLNNIDERKIKNCKVRAHPGASIEQMYYHLAVHLQKKPSYVILLAGTNNCTADSGEEVFEKLMKLKTFILSRCCCEVYISTLITRVDNQTAGRVVDEVNKQLLDLNDKGVLKLLNNTNITKFHLGRKGLHLSDRGTGKLITNIVSFVKHIQGL